MLRIAYDELLDTLLRVLLKLEFEPDRARHCARLFAETTRDGVYSHGVDRFPRFIRAIRAGLVDVHARPELVQGFGALERWNGNSGVGNLNAHHCMGRAIDLSRSAGIGCVALANTNHWMRGGSYGWQAVEAGAIGICWTNTLPNLPPWGASDPRVGNNPLVIAVPRQPGHIVLDMAMSQFSYGMLASYARRGELLPVDGGFDRQGQLSRDPAEIEAARRPLPIGYWKGSGLSLMLDLVAGILSGGRVTFQIPADPEKESGLSQIFIAVSSFDQQFADQIADEVIGDLHRPRSNEAEHVRYPAERVVHVREENMRLGLPVDPSVWREVLAL